MKHHQELATLQRSSSYNNNYKLATRNRRITPSTVTPGLEPSSKSNNLHRSVSLSIPENEEISDILLIPRSSSSPRSSSLQRLHNVNSRFSSLLRSFIKIIAFPNLINIPTSCKWLTLPTHLSITTSLGRKVTGTLFGNRRGHVSFAVQDDTRSEPVLLLELAMSTASLVKEMSSGLVRIALECEKGSGQPNRTVRLFHEPMWTMYCNGKKNGYAARRMCNESDWHVLSTVQSVSVGAGVIPVVEDARKGGGGSEGELLYMRAKFERVVGSRDSEAFYMMNPDNNGGPELSIFLLRI